MQWDLTRLYKSFSDPAFAADMAAAEALTDKLSALFAAPAADTAEQLCALINTFNELHSLTARFRSMVMLTLSADAQNEEALAYNDKLQNFSVRMRQQSSAFSRYVGSIENLEELIASNELLKEHAFVLRFPSYLIPHLCEIAENSLKNITILNPSLRNHYCIVKYLKNTIQIKVK